jgi:hypothetical protein
MLSLAFGLASRLHTSKFRWRTKGIGQTSTPVALAATGSLINSVQHVFLFRSDMHQLLDGYEVSINPDDVCVT